MSSKFLLLDTTDAFQFLCVQSIAVFFSLGDFTTYKESSLGHLSFRYTILMLLVYLCTNCITQIIQNSLKLEEY
jgi:hypothetical protein